MLVASCAKDETIRIWNNNIEGSSVAFKAHSAPVRTV